MGATDCILIIKHKASKREIEQRIQNRIDEDSALNGHQDGYSGDFQTIIAYHYKLDLVFANLEDALTYCTKQTTKWESTIVYFKSKSGPSLQTLVYGLAAC